MKYNGETNDIEKKYYTVREAALVLGVDDKSVYKAIQRRQLPSRKLGRRILIPRLAVDPVSAIDEAGRVSSLED